MKKLLSLLLLAGLLFGCSSSNGNKIDEITKNAKDDKEAFTMLWNYNIENVRSYKCITTWKNSKGISQITDCTAWFSDTKHENSYSIEYMPEGVVYYELLTDDLQQDIHPDRDDESKAKISDIIMDELPTTLLNKSLTDHITKIEKIDEKTYKINRSIEQDVYKTDENGDVVTDDQGKFIFDHKETLYLYDEISFDDNGLILKGINMQTDKDGKQLEDISQSESVYSQINEKIDVDKIISDFKALDGQDASKVLKHTKF